MRMKFWSDSNQTGFEDEVVALGASLCPLDSYEYEVPDELVPVALAWGATEVTADVN